MKHKLVKSNPSKRLPPGSPLFIFGRRSRTKPLSVLSVGHCWPPRAAHAHGQTVRTSHGLSFPILGITGHVASPQGN